MGKRNLHHWGDLIRAQYLDHQMCVTVFKSTDLILALQNILIGLIQDFVELDLGLLLDAG